MTNQQNERSNNGKRIVLIMLAILLIAAIAFGAYTYSKYVTSKEGTGSATVAQWGFEVSMTNGENAGFSTKYNQTGVANESGTAIVADTSTDGNIVAPGANGSMTFTVGGSAEVLAKIKTTVESTSEISLTLKQADKSVVYYPIKYTLKEGENTALVTDGTMEEVETQIGAIQDLNKTVAANTEITKKTYTLSWEWVFESATLVVDEENRYTVQCDELDTILGKIAAGDPTENYTVKDSNEADWTISKNDAKTKVDFSITVSITQAQS